MNIKLLDWKNFLRLEPIEIIMGKMDIIEFTKYFKLLTYVKE